MSGGDEARGSAAADDVYLGRLAAALHGARGNDRFPQTRALSNLVKAWRTSLSMSPSSIPPPLVDAGSGLPPWLSWAALLAEREMGASVAPRTAAEAPPTTLAGAVAGGDDARSRLRRREQAAALLFTAPAAPLLEVNVAVRRVATGKALLTLVLDRAFASGRFVRIAIDAWVSVKSENGVVVDDDHVSASADLKELLSLASHLPAPALLVRAAALPGVDVERISRGVVGPCHSRFGGPALTHVDDPFALIIASEDVSKDIAVSVDNDAFADDDFAGLMAALPVSLSGWRAFRDAKVVATTTTAPALRARAVARGKQTVIHTLG